MCSMRNRPRFQISAALLLLACLPLLVGCVGTAVGAGAAAGIAAYEERGVKGVARDLGIQAQIFNGWLQHDHTLPTKVGAEVYEGRVLLTGVVRDEQQRADAVRLTWAVEGVEEVLNEIQLTGGGVVNLAKDSWITTQLKSRLTFDETVYAINYAVETVDGTVYLIGTAQDDQELRQVIGHARDIKYVRRVISHVRIKAPTKDAGQATGTGRTKEGT